MSNTKQVMAQEFVKFTGRQLAHKTVTLHHRITAPNEYWLHGSTIAKQYEKGGPITFDWCGFYTPTTASHMNEILKAAGYQKRVSYAQARKAGDTSFTV